LDSIKHGEVLLRAKNQHNRSLCSVNGERVALATIAGLNVTNTFSAVFRRRDVE